MPPPGCRRVLAWSSSSPGVVDVLEAVVEQNDLETAVDLIEALSSERHPGTDVFGDEERIDACQLLEPERAQVEQQGAVAAADVEHR